jgi:hypothetical protein
MKKTVTFETILGFLCFIALMLAGFAWLFGLIDAQGVKNVCLYLKRVAMFILIGCAVLFGFLWLYGTKMNKTLKIVLMVFFVLFAVLAIFGVVNL